MACIEEDDTAAALIFVDMDLSDRFHLGVVGDRVHRAFLRFKNLDFDVRLIGQERAVPAPGAERADRGEGEKRGAQGNDRSLGREIIGGASLRRRDQNAVADEFVEAYRAIDGNAQLRRLIGLAQERDLVHGKRMGCFAVHAERRHGQRVNPGRDRLRNAPRQIVERIFVHQETDRSLVHAVNRFFAVEKRIHGMKHHAIAAEGYDAVGVFRAMLAVARDAFVAGMLGIRLLGSHEVKFFEHKNVHTKSFLIA